MYENLEGGYTSYKSSLDTVKPVMITIITATTT